jgi:hypothetical protein
MSQVRGANGEFKTRAYALLPTHHPLHPPPTLSNYTTLLYTPPAFPIVKCFRQRLSARVARFIPSYPCACPFFDDSDLMPIAPFALRVPACCVFITSRPSRSRVLCVHHIAPFAFPRVVCSSHRALRVPACCVFITSRPSRSRVFNHHSTASLRLLYRYEMKDFTWVRSP